MTGLVVYLYLVGCLTVYIALVMVKPDDTRMNVFGPLTIGFWFIAIPIVAVLAVRAGFAAAKEAE